MYKNFDPSFLKDFYQKAILYYAISDKKKNHGEPNDAKYSKNIFDKFTC